MNRLALLPLFAAAAGFASATPFTVDAKANSSTDGTLLDTISLTAGEQFTVSASPNDLWSAGDLPRWSNADGLTHNVYATGSDASGQAAGTLIGQDWGLYSQDGFTAPYGTLVGKIGGTYMNLGTSYSGSAPSAGTLKLMYWDSNSSDNFGHITANVQAVPEPESLGVLGIGALGLLKRRRKA